MLNGINAEPAPVQTGFVLCECLGSAPVATDGEPSTLELVLVDATTTKSAWELDDHTRAVGRDGIAMARQALRAAAQRVAQ